MSKNVLYGFSGKQAGVESEGGGTFFELEDVRETLEHFGLVLEDGVRRDEFCVREMSVAELEARKKALESKLKVLDAMKPFVKAKKNESMKSGVCE